LPKITETKPGIIVNGITVKDPEERATKSIVRIKDNETVILGGLIRNQFSETRSKLPFLGDIPMIGALFRNKNTSQNNERELLVFITPHIVKDNNIALASATTTALPEREQNTVSGMDRRLVIESSLNNFDAGK